jgi:hypothetical protein
MWKHRLEQNLNIISANVLPLSSLCSKNIRPISQALNDAASAREIDAASMLSKRSQASRAERRRSEASTDMMIDATHQQRRSFDSSSSSTHETGSRGAETWPMGIIKTVSIKVVEEDAANVGDPDLERGNGRRISGQQNWDSYLR